MLDLYIAHVFLQACLKPSLRCVPPSIYRVLRWSGRRHLLTFNSVFSRSLVLAPIFVVSAWTLSAWCAEAVADMRAGSFNSTFW